jgi:hypothetical protein
VTDDLLTSISRDLGSLRRDRRRQFLPAVLLTVVIVAGVATGLGLRPDLFEQPPWQLALQAAVWMVCLVAFPAIGVGLWFPSRATRLVLAIGGVALAIVSSVGIQPFASSNGQGATAGPCWLVLAGCGFALLVVGAWSGAFAQRRARSSTFWIAAGLALAALEVVTWTCPCAETGHVVTMHFGPALLVVVIAATAGALLHRRRR